MNHSLHASFLLRAVWCWTVSQSTGTSVIPNNNLTTRALKIMTHTVMFFKVAALFQRAVHVIRSCNDTDLLLNYSSQWWDLPPTGCCFHQGHLLVLSHCHNYWTVIIWLQRSVWCVGFWLMLIMLDAKQHNYEG